MLSLKYLQTSIESQIKITYLSRVTNAVRIGISLLIQFYVTNTKISKNKPMHIKINKQVKRTMKFTTAFAASVVIF